ncbi:MucB/RseB C-terminal domain-containing protein [Usitatibacter palustris]|uniref:Sigma factor AlgU regulatory protein MucB n=1 Tax=Usitatibacter palustris TaxID=2732487 RepID=A0A6M4H6Q3_9PROT|nr:MucB/RseB C-terminal domain-containing protein [Usitatibacter palustris]QJR15309.1 Sigma factor AlgU regulatory protein MucB [Usitatibacter palustris]
MKPRHLLITLAVAGSLPAIAADPNTDPLAWLQRAATAAKSSTYSGTFVHTSGERTQTMRVTHVVVGGDEHERIQSLDGPPQEIVRRNDEMFCYLPDAKTVRLDRRVTARFFPSIFRAAPEAIAQNYDLKLGKVERVIGYECQWIRLEPRDALRFAQRLCAELASGLLMRAKTLNEKNQVIEQFTFTELKLGPQVARSDVRSTFSAQIRQWTTDKRPLEEAKGADTGWMVANPPAGYRQVSEMRRTFPGREQPVSQIVLTDGLASMSVFVEPANGAVRPEASSEDGTTSYYVRPSGDQVITVLGEVPAAAVQQAGRGVQRRP